MTISKTLRFEVFKRDGFQCQYCGKQPPEIVLEVDHIIPRKRKGKNDIDNLITSCFDCNRGKGARDLKIAPPGTENKLRILKEKEEQLKEYNKFLEKIERRIQKDINEIDEIYNSYFKKWWFSETFRNNTLKRFLKFLPKQIVADAIHLACYNMLKKGGYHPENSAIRYFCGICWNRIRDKK